MFKKLLSNLPFNPSLLGEVSFYAKRLHRESVVRGAGSLMITMAMVLQMFAVFAPAEASVRESSSDLIHGGFTTKAEAVSHCRQNTRNYKVIMEHFGITCADISDSNVTSIGPRDHDGKLWSMGRLPYGVKDEQTIKIPGAGTFYLRHFWSLNKAPSYKALTGKTKYGLKFFILFDCGNLVFITLPEPPKDVCTNKDGIQTKPEDCDVCPDVKGIQKKKSECDVCPTTPGVQSQKSECDLCPKIPGVQTEGGCDVCPNVRGNQSKVEDCDVCPNLEGIQLEKSECDVCENKSGVQDSANECDVCDKIPGVQTTKDQCEPCKQASDEGDATACLEYKKVGRNVTQGIGDANGTTAAANDTVEYTLTTTNKGKITITNYAVTENISDVLDYADVVDLHGGTMDAEKAVTWPAREFKPNQSVTNRITVRIKAVIPTTPASSSDPAHFDNVMTNVYGNAVNIKLPATLAKQTELVTTSLPNTGPGTSLAIAFTLVVFITYFFTRSRLMAKELDLVRVEYANTGGY